MNSAMTMCTMAKPGLAGGCHLDLKTRGSPAQSNEMDPYTGMLRMQEVEACHLGSVCDQQTSTLFRLVYVYDQRCMSEGCTIFPRNFITTVRQDSGANEDDVQLMWHHAGGEDAQRNQGHRPRGSRHAGDRAAADWACPRPLPAAQTRAAHSSAGSSGGHSGGLTALPLWGSARRRRSGPPAAAQLPAGGRTPHILASPSTSAADLREHYCLVKHCFCRAWSWHTKLGRHIAPIVLLLTNLRKEGINA